MTFKIDYVDDAVLEWTITADGVTYTRNRDYTPNLFISGESRDELEKLRPFVGAHNDVKSIRFVTRRTVWRDDPEAVLEVDVADIDAITQLASEVRGWGAPGEYKLYNVDFAREYRYCLDNGIVPVPEEVDWVTTCELMLPPKPLNDWEIAPLEVNGDVYADERAALAAVAETFAADDPDVLILSSGELIPLLAEKIEASDRWSFDLGRVPGWQQLARESTFESYGRVGHSPARYNVPGRAIIDKSNSFFWGQTTLGGLFDLVERSAKPLQETAWASIGNVFTSIQIHEAIDAGVLVPWNSWRHEKFKPMSTLHDADRGGFIFAPEVGFHEDVHELDFSSLYPSIMITKNVSPDVIRCECHRDRSDVPGLGYSICDDDGFLVSVLEPMVQDREAYKAEMQETDDPEREAEFRGRSNALKWVLVSCFGYQGFSNAKFGRIECHEAINAFAREILLDTKELLEAHGWEIIHGIVDSVWVRAIEGREQEPLEKVAAEISDEIEIPLDYEAQYDWIAFAPRKDGDAGALNRYFAKHHGEDDFKKRGIEIRQRSTPQYIEDCQTELLEVLDEYREPEPVCDRLEVQLNLLQKGAVNPQNLVIKRRVSKPVDAYSHYTRNVSALERANAQDFQVQPGENVEFVVVDDSRRSADRVSLAFEEPDRYDTKFYSNLLIRAGESILSPLGWDRKQIRSYLAGTEETSITAY